MKKALYSIWRLFYPMLIYFIAISVVEMGFMLYYMITEGTFDGNGFGVVTQDLVDYIYKNSLYITTVVNLVLIPALGYFIYKDEKRRKQSENIEYTKPGKKAYIVIAVLGIASAIAANGIIAISGLAYLSPAYQEVSEIIYSGGLFIELVSAVVAAPIVEELLFRGLIYTRLKVLMSSNAAIIVSAAIFGIFHGNLVQFVYALIIGLLIAYVYEKYKTIFAPIMFHVSANLISVLITELLPEKYMTILTLAVATIIMTVITVKAILYIRNDNSIIVKKAEL